jgi:hypothetical protein
MDLMELWLRLRRWLWLLVIFLVFARTSFLLGAKLYLGVPFSSADLIIGGLCLSAGAFFFVYAKGLFRQERKRS